MPVHTVAALMESVPLDTKEHVSSHLGAIGNTVHFRDGYAPAGRRQFVAAAGSHGIEIRHPRRTPHVGHHHHGPVGRQRLVVGMVGRVGRDIAGARVIPDVVEGGHAIQKHQILVIRDALHEPARDAAEEHIGADLERPAGSGDVNNSDCPLRLATGCSTEGMFTGIATFPVPSAFIRRNPAADVSEGMEL